MATTGGRPCKNSFAQNHRLPLESLEFTTLQFFKYFAVAKVVDSHITPNCRTVGTVECYDKIRARNSNAWKPIRNGRKK
jgi:hypothetical protein